MASPRLGWLGAALALALLPLQLGCARQAGGRAAEGAFSTVQRAQEEHPGSAPVVEHATAGVVRGALRELSVPEEQAEIRRLVDLVTVSALGSATGQPTGYGWGGGPGGATPPPLHLAGAVFGQGFTSGMIGELRLRLGEGQQGAPGFALAPDAALLGNQLAAGFTAGAVAELRRQVDGRGGGPLGDSAAELADRMTAASLRTLSDALGTSEECKDVDRAGCADRRVRALARVAALGAAEGFAASLRWPLLVLAFVSGLVLALVWAVLFRRAAEAG